MAFRGLFLHYFFKWLKLFKMLYPSFIQHGSVFPAARNVPFKDMESQMCTQLCYQKFIFQSAKAGKEVRKPKVSVATKSEGETSFNFKLCRVHTGNELYF